LFEIQILDLVENQRDRRDLIPWQVLISSKLSKLSLLFLFCFSPAALLDRLMNAIFWSVKIWNHFCKIEGLYRVFASSFSYPSGQRASLALPFHSCKFYYLLSLLCLTGYPFYAFCFCWIFFLICTTKGNTCSFNHLIWIRP
jgi:hypothetical protein